MNKCDLMYELISFNLGETKHHLKKPRGSVFQIFYTYSS